MLNRLERPHRVALRLLERARAGPLRITDLRKERAELRPHGGPGTVSRARSKGGSAGHAEATTCRKRSTD